MAKRNRVEVEDDFDSEVEETIEETEQSQGGFSISKKKLNKPEILMTAIGFTVQQTEHLRAVAKANGTTRAEFCRQAVAYCLNEMGQPLPKG